MKVSPALLLLLVVVVRSAPVIHTVGATVSTVKDRDTTSLWFPAGSTLSSAAWLEPMGSQIHPQISRKTRIFRRPGITQRVCLRSPHS